MSNISISAKVIKNKLGLLELAKDLGNISQACKIMGYLSVIDTNISRDEGLQAALV